MAVTLSGMVLYTNNDNESNWGGTDGPDTYNVAVQGTNSESWLVSKNNSETGTLTLTPGTAPDATRSLFIFWMKSDLQYYYTDIRAELQSTASNYKQFICATAAIPDISGDFKPIALDYVNKGTATGTYAPASHTVTRIIVDNSSSGNIRSVINNWIDVMYFGPGHAIAGTTTGDLLFSEAAALDQNGTNEYGILNNFEGVVFSQGDLDLTGTSLTSNGETLVFIDTANGYDRYNFDITGTATFTDTAIRASGTVDFDMDASGATSFTMTGGSLTQGNQLTLKDRQDFSGVVITDQNLSSINNNPTNCTWNISGLVTVEVTGQLNACTFSNSTSSAAVLTSNLSDAVDCTFISDGSNHAIELSALGSGTMTWENYLTGYATADGSTGNEAIYVNVASGTLTINVTSGYDTPFIRTAGAVVTVVAGAVVTKVTAVTTSGDPIQNARVLLRAADGTAAFPFRESVTITRVSTTASVAHTAHGMANGDKVQIRQANQQDYNGVFIISNVTTNAYDYTVANSPTTPATGSIISTWVALEGLTDIDGEIEMSRVISTDQPITGWARKSSASPYYAQGGINGTIDNALGLSATAALILDE